MPVETLIGLVPDVDVLLSLAPEELAPILLRLARGQLQNGMFQPDSVAGSDRLYVFGWGSFRPKFA